MKLIVTRLNQARWWVDIPDRGAFSVVTAELGDTRPCFSPKRSAQSSCPDRREASMQVYERLSEASVGRHLHHNAAGVARQPATEVHHALEYGAQAASGGLLESDHSCPHQRLAHHPEHIVHLHPELSEASSKAASSTHSRRACFMISRARCRTPSW